MIEELPCCMPGQLPATTSYSPSPNDPPYLLYTGTCCPVGQVPQPNGSCLPAHSFISTCPGGGAFNAQTNSCCPPENSITNKYVCCPPNQSPQVDGSCGCPPAQVQQSDGSCLPLCNANSIPSPLGGTCTYCPPGQIGTSQGVCCAPNQVTTNGFCCPAGWNPQGTACNRPPMWRAAPNTGCGAGGYACCGFKIGKTAAVIFRHFRKGFSRPAAPAAHALIECRAELFATTAKASLFGHCFEAFYGWTPRLSLLTINEVVNKNLCSLFGSRRLAGSTVDLHKTAKGRGNKVLAFRLAQQPVDRSSRAHFDFAQGSQNCVVCFPKREAVLCRRLANLPQPQRHREMPK